MRKDTLLQALDEVREYVDRTTGETLELGVGRHAFWHNPDDYRDFIARPLRRVEEVFVNEQHRLESFMDEVSVLLEVPVGQDQYGGCIEKLERLTGREL